MTLDEAMEELKKGRLIEHKPLDGDIGILCMCLSEKYIKSADWYVSECRGKTHERY